MRFPHSMVKHKFNDKYEVILCALWLILDCSDMEDRVFAAMCIWWLASIIQFTDILLYYRHTKIFPPDYLNDLVFMPLEQTHRNPCSIPDSENTKLTLNSILVLEQNLKSPESINTWNTTGREKYYTPQALVLQFGRETSQERARMHKSIRGGKVQYLGRLRWNIILPIVSVLQIYEGNDRGRFHEDTCQFRLHYQRAKYYHHDIN